MLKNHSKTKNMLKVNDINLEYIYMHIHMYIRIHIHVCMSHIQQGLILKVYKGCPIQTHQKGAGNE